MDEGVVFQATDTVVDALGVQEVERFPDVAGWAFLAGVRHRAEAVRARLRENFDELRRRVTDFGRVESDAQDVGAGGEHCVEGGHGRFGAVVAQDGDDQSCADPVTALGVVEGRRHTFEDSFEWDSAGDVCLWIEEDFGMADAGKAGAGKVCLGHVGEVLGCPQGRHVRVVQVQERLEIVEAIARREVVDIGVRQGDPVALGEPEDGLGFEGAFQVEVQFGFRQRPDGDVRGARFGGHLASSVVTRSRNRPKPRSRATVISGRSVHRWWARRSTTVMPRVSLSSVATSQCSAVTSTRV
jgi:hypothetical protein